MTQNHVARRKALIAVLFPSALGLRLLGQPESPAPKPKRPKQAHEGLALILPKRYVTSMDRKTGAQKRAARREASHAIAGVKAVAA